MKQYIYITNPIYPVRFHVFLNYKTLLEIKQGIKFKKKTDIKLAQDEIDKLEWNTSDGYCVFYRGNIFILIKEFIKSAKCYDTLHHEISHAVFKSGEHLGFQYSVESEEFYSYMHGFITNQIYKKIL